MMMCYSSKTYSSRNPLLKSYFWSRLKKMAQVAESSNARVILDIGCGKGELLQIIAKRPLRYEYVGIDIGVNIDDAKRRAKLERMENTQFLKADCTHLPFRSNSSQLVFCASILEHLPDVPPAISELDRVLEVDGKLVVGVPTENHVYQLSRAIAGLQKPTDHYHKGAYLETLLARRFPHTKSTTLPFSFLPRSLSLYSVLECGKHLDSETIC
jgi:ubiquinone/menaquinone biosynthesis C-methylase UbiE